MFIQKNYCTSNKKRNTNQEIDSLHPVKSSENAMAKTLIFNSMTVKN
jgi:hypothetical protein